MKLFILVCYIVKVILKRMWLNVIYATLNAKKCWSATSPVTDMWSAQGSAGSCVVLQVCC